MAGKPYEFHDFSVKVTEAMTDALIAGLKEAAGELQARTVRNSRQSQEYGDKKATALWDYRVNEAKLEAYVGSEHEAGYWEEFGTGQNHSDHPEKARPGWWVYIEGGSDYEGKTNKYNTKEEAEQAAEFIRKVKKLNAYATDGIEPNRPLQRAFKSGKKAVETIFANKLKGMG